MYLYYRADPTESITDPHRWRVRSTAGSRRSACRCRRWWRPTCDSTTRAMLRYPTLWRPRRRRSTRLRRRWAPVCVICLALRREKGLCSVSVWGTRKKKIVMKAKKKAIDKITPEVSPSLRNLSPSTKRNRLCSVSVWGTRKKKIVMKAKKKAFDKITPEVRRNPVCVMILALRR